MKVPAFLVLALVLVAGCLGGDQAPAPASPSSSASTSSATPTSAPGPEPAAAPPVIDLLIGFALTDCQGVLLQHARPLDDIQTLLPPGFNASAQPGSADPRGLVLVELYACGNFTAASATVPATYFGAVTTLIERPSQRVPGAPDAPRQEYLFRVLAGEDVLAVLWPAAGYDLHNGSAAMQVRGAGLPLDTGARSASGSVADAYEFLATGTLVPGIPSGVQGAFARYTALGDGSVLVWTGLADVPSAATGEGSVRLAADDPVASLGLGVPGEPTLAGTALLQDTGNFLDQQLRRVFTPAPAS